jgi:peptidoglycan hydrolase CwlO-like protein
MALNNFLGKIMTAVAIPFDTLKMVDRLVKSGVPTEQAKAQTELLAEAISAEDSSIADRFATKQDVAQELLSIKLALDKLDSKIDKLDSKIDKSAAEVKGELIRWVVTVVGAVGILQMALIAGLVLKLVH